MNKNDTFFRKTKIVATLGPSSTDKIETLIKIGVNVFRLNFSHGNHSEHAKSIKMIDEARHKLKKWVGILADLQGPKIRVGKVKKDNNNNDIPLKLIEKESFIVTTEEIIGEGNRISTSYKNLPKEVKKNQRIYFDDGNLCIRVKKIKNNDVFTTVEVGGLLSSNKGINLPDTDIKSPALTEKDKKDLTFILNLRDKIDCIALSFVRNQKDIQNVKDIMKKEKKSLPIIAKIERPEGIKNIDSIIENSSGIMVARGDLGVEVEPESVPHHQKMIIKKCNLAGKPVIVATQMLDSIIKNPRSTRAEAADCANAVLDGASALMLSGETANGKYPLEAVKVMNKIISYTELSPSFENQQLINDTVNSDEESITLAAVKLANNSADAKAIFCITQSGKTAKQIAKYRSKTPVIALTPQVTSEIRFLSLYWGIYITIFTELKKQSTRISDIEDKIKSFDYINKNDLTIITCGLPLLTSNSTNIIKIYRLSS